MTWKPDICVYHGNCDDGFGAAWAIRKKWPDIRFVAGQYGKPLFADASEYADNNILFVDFSLKKQGMIDLAWNDIGPVANSILILDHHKTAEAELQMWNIGPLGEVDADMIQGFFDRTVKGELPIIACFDMGHSGAVMAWEFITPLADRKNMPLALKLIEDRDLWKFNYSETERFSAALRSYPQDFAVWDHLMENPQLLISEGTALLRAHKKLVDQICEQAYMATVMGHQVPVANASYHYASDVAHRLLQLYPDAPYAMTWFKRGDGKFQASLRSEDSRQDVSLIAKACGGGGHRNAAGFEMTEIPA